MKLLRYFKSQRLYNSVSPRRSHRVREPMLIRERTVHTRETPIVHGDLKTVSRHADIPSPTYPRSQANVLVFDGHASLCDFGHTKVHDRVIGLSDTNVFYSTPFRAPEMRGAANKKRYPTCESDIFAFGSVLYEVRAYHSFICSLANFLITDVVRGARILRYLRQRTARLLAQ